MDTLKDLKDQLELVKRIKRLRKEKDFNTSLLDETGDKLKLKISTLAKNHLYKLTDK